MGFTREDLRGDLGILPGINLNKIRFGPRVERRKPLEVRYMGQPVGGSAKPGREERRNQTDPNGDAAGHEKYQLRLW